MQTYLESAVSKESSPFLAENAPLKASAAVLDAPSFPRIKTGHLLYEGDFSQTFQVRKIDGQKTSEKFSIKYLHPKVAQQPSVDAFRQAVQKLVLEALYLSSLNNENILRLHGFSIGDDFQQEKLESVFLLLPGIAETLEHRMEKWKRLRRDREMNKSRREMFVKALEMDIARATAQKMKEDLGTDRAGDFYPDDLVALQTNYALQIARALEYLHERKIVLRDLTPSTICFREYPHHHTIQLFDLSSCQEIPQDQSLLPPEQVTTSNYGRFYVSMASTTSSCDSSTSTDVDKGTLNGLGSLHVRFYGTRRPGLRRSSMDQSSRSDPGRERRDNLKSTQRGRNSETQPRSNPKHYRAPESYTLAKELLENNDSAHVPALTAPSKTYVYNGYDCKADIYSWSMIYYEMLAEGKHISNRVLSREDHYYRVQTLGQRPDLNKYHFPRSIKAVLEQAWDPVPSKRHSSEKVCKSLGLIFNMLEGQGLPWTANNVVSGTPEICAATTDASSSSAAPSKQQPNISLELSLPERAANLMIHQPSSANGWSRVWDGTDRSEKLDPEEVFAAFQSERKKKVTSNSGKKKSPFLKKVTSLRRLIPFDCNAGMVKSARNEATVKRLLGPDYEKKIANKK